MSTAAIISVLLGLLGGIVSGANMVFGQIYAQLQGRILKNAKAAQEKEVPAEPNDVSSVETKV